jgi:hypothetical protein
MKYRALSFSCECGRAPLRITQVGLTADHQLLIQWWCAECKKMVDALKPLSECWRDWPSNPELPETFYVEDVEAEDARFLQSVGIKAGGSNGR